MYNILYYQSNFCNFINLFYINYILFELRSKTMNKYNIFYYFFKKLFYILSMPCIFLYDYKVFFQVK